MKLHFMRYRKLSYWISGALVVLSILSLLFHGLNYGIDFAGGSDLRKQVEMGHYNNYQLQ